MNRTLKRLRQLVALVMVSTVWSATVKAETSTVDMLVLYTPQATQTWEGRDINARIQSFIEYFNRTLRNADVQMKVRVVHTEAMTWGGNLNRATNANLRALSRDARVNQLRNRYGADIVTLVYQNPPRESCGMGWISTGMHGRFQPRSAVGDHGYNLSAVNCYMHIVAHEAGHNMGLRHSPLQDPQEGYRWPNWHTGSFPYSRGYGMNGRFVTPMAYPNVYGTWNVQPIFSSPRKNCNGMPCGVVDHADAAWALDVMRNQIAGFRATRIPEGGGQDPNQPRSLYDFGANRSSWQPYVSQLTPWDENGTKMLWVGNRQRTNSGAIGNLNGVLQSGRRYRIQAEIGVANPSSNQLTSWLYLENNRGAHEWIPVAQRRIPGNEWVPFSAEVDIQLPQVNQALLYVYGPNAGSGFSLRNVQVFRK